MIESFSFEALEQGFMGFLWLELNFPIFKFEKNGENFKYSDVWGRKDIKQVLGWVGKKPA